MELWYTEKHTDNSGLTVKIKETLFFGKSDFQELTILDTYEYGKMMLLDGLVMLTEKDEFVYHEMLVHPSLYTHPNPEKVLIIGGGDGGTLREVLRHSKVKKAVMVEIDELVIKQSEIFFPQLTTGFKSPRAEVIVGDGIKFVKETQEKFDVILVDSTDPVGPAEGLFNKEFYNNCYRILNDNGILTTQSETPFIDSFAKIIPEIHAIFRTVFAHTKLYLGSIPTYPAGLWSFTMGSKKYDPELTFNTENYQNDKLSFNYYNEQIHKSAFALPTFIRNKIDE